MDIKRFKANVQVHDGAEEGRITAMFSVFHKRDSDGDVVLPSFFKDGQAIPMSAWGHKWGELPPGKGEIGVQEKGAVFEGHFFMDTDHGLQHFRTVRNMGDLQEWSFGFKITEQEEREYTDPDTGDSDGIANYLIAGETFEAAPVLVGSNRETVTLAIKGGDKEIVQPRYGPFDSEEKPYANEHACRLEDPGKFIRFRRDNDADPNRIYGFLSGGGSRIQAYRYPTSTWTAARARAHCGKHDGTFEAAKAAMLENARAWLEFLAKQPPDGKQSGWQEKDRDLKEALEKERTRMEVTA